MARNILSLLPKACARHAFGDLECIAEADEDSAPPLELMSTARRTCGSSGTSPPWAGYASAR